MKVMSGNGTGDEGRIFQTLTTMGCRNRKQRQRIRDDTMKKLMILLLAVSNISTLLYILYK